MSVYDTAAASTSVTPAIVDVLLRGRADLHKPTYRQLSVEGLSNRAIETLHLGRDMLATESTPYEFAQWLWETHSAFPLSEADVWPEGKPERWVRWDRERAQDREISAHNERRDGFYRANRGAWS